MCKWYNFIGTVLGLFRYHSASLLLDLQPRRKVRHSVHWQQHSEQHPVLLDGSLVLEKHLCSMAKVISPTVFFLLSELLSMESTPDYALDMPAFCFLLRRYEYMHIYMYIHALSCLCCNFTAIIICKPCFLVG